tara:strand:+ start:394 stop:681 length:288 start_codon:yes stop_codon:yes gene_type:complete
MPGAHRDTDSRFCTAVTIVQNQSTVYVNDLLWGVNGDPNNHGAGNLIAEFGELNIYIEDKLIIVAVGDKAAGDNFLHPTGPTNPSGSSSDVFAYD